MNGRRWLILISALLLVGAGATIYWLPTLARHVAIARVHALTNRPVTISRVDLQILEGRLRIRGLRLLEHDGHTPSADVAEIDARVRLPSLLLGHLWIRQLAVTRPTVRVVRLPGGEFNLSDLVRTSGTTRRALDVTVDHFALNGGTVVLTDEALPDRRTWTSENIVIDAHHISTRRSDGTAIGRSVTAGAPVAIEISRLRLYPIHLEGVVTVEGLDLTPARVYLPPAASVTLGRGRATTSLKLVLDAREGLRVDANARLENVAVVTPSNGKLVATVPAMTTNVANFAYRDGALALTRLALDGVMSVRNPAARPGHRFEPSTVRASVSNLTWPATSPGQLAFLTSIPGGGTLTVTGALRPPPAPSQLRVQLAGVDVAPWAQFLPLGATITGRADADLRTDEPLAAGVPLHVRGSATVTRLDVRDGQETLGGARRVEARGLAVEWPTRIVVERVLVTRPRGTFERDAAGRFRLGSLLGGPPADGVAAPASDTGARLSVDVHEVAVRSGAVAWRDQTTSPPARLALNDIDGTVSDLGWPLRRPARVRLALTPPGGGHVSVTGRVGFHPVSADLRVVAKQADLAAYAPYLGTPARVTGAANLDLAVAVPDAAASQGTVRGTLALAHVDVRDGERTVARLPRATAIGIDVDWPEHVAVDRLTLAGPWILLERDEKGRLALRAFLMPSTRARPGQAPGETAASGSRLPVSIAEVSVDRGGTRIVDRSLSPAFAVDVHDVSMKIEGLSTTSEKPATIDVVGQVASASKLRLHGTIGAIDGPLRLDLAGEVSGFAVPRTNPYLLEYVGWKTTDGRLTSQFTCRVDGDALAAKTDVRVGGLHVVRAGRYDGAQAHIGLPLGLITTLMKDRRGDITMSFPVGGRLSDPRFDLSQAIWGAVRTVAINAITLPVSWIGRVHFTRDARIERIDVNPVAFEPGTATLTAEGLGQAERLAAFLDRLPEVTIGLTPVVSSGDVEELRRRRLDGFVERAARRERVSRDVALTRLFAERSPGCPAPDTPEATYRALLEQQQVPASDVSDLAARRIDVVRAAAKDAGIDFDRLRTMATVQQEGTESHVDLAILEPDDAHPSKVRHVLRRLGLPVRDRRGP